MKKAKFMSNVLGAALKQKTSYSTLTQNTIFNPHLPKNSSNIFAILAQTEQTVSEIKNQYFVQARDAGEKKILAEYLESNRELAAQLVEQKKYSAAIKVCEACLEPYNNGQLIMPTEELKSFYKFYIHIKNTGASPIKRQELLKTLDKTIELFPEDDEFKEIKQDILGSIEINRLINEGSLKLS